MTKTKILVVASSHNMIRNFLIPNVKMFRKWGYEVHIVGGGESFADEDVADRVITLPINRSPYTIANIQGYKQLRRLIEEERYALVDCHSPVGGAIARLAARNARKRYGTKVSYTTHGFAFYRGSAKWKWHVFYPIEKRLAAMTDAIITINAEDYETVTNGQFQAEICKIPGIGVQTSRLCFPSAERKRELHLRFGLEPDDTVIVYMAEFIKRKNHRLIIDAIAMLKERHPRLKAIFLGVGPLFDAMRRYAKKKGVADKIIFAGFTRAIGPIIAGCDIGVSTSYTEGLPMNIAEEMYIGLPIVASDCRGHRDLIDSGKNGLLYSTDTPASFAEALETYLDDPAFAAAMATAAQRKVRDFLLDKSLAALASIYSRLLGLQSTTD